MNPQRMWRRYGRLTLVLLGLVALTLAAGTRARAQAPAETAAEAAPARGQTRAAPYREPQILRQETQPDGTTNTVIALPAVADAYIASERPNENFGMDALFLGYNLVGQNNYGAERVLLRFDVDTFVPPGAVIHQATLQLRVSFASPPGDAPMGTVLRRLASSWDELTVTWNSEPAWTPVDATADVSSDPVWVEWDLTQEVDNWAQGVYPNDGVEIIGDEAVQQRERAFYSRETTTDQYPRLVIDYTDTGDTLPPIITVDPLPATVRRSFTVSWSGSDQGSAGLAYTDVQVRIDGGPWVDWVTASTEKSAEYTQAENGRVYEFRARGVDYAGNVEPYGPAEAMTTADTEPPTAAVDPLPALISADSFTVTWSGSDGVSGIQYYDVQMRVDNGPWMLWQQQTLATSFLFQTVPDGHYQFEARAVDQVGHVEPFTDVAEASVIVDADAPFVEPALWLPVMLRP